MARVFAQEAWHKCREQGIDSRYEMILLAAHRGRNMHKVSKDKQVLPAEEYNNVSVSVTALREFETGKLDIQELREDYLKQFMIQNEVSEEILETEQS